MNAWVASPCAFYTATQVALPGELGNLDSKSYASSPRPAKTAPWQTGTTQIPQVGKQLQRQPQRSPAVQPEQISRLLTLHEHWCTNLSSVPASMKLRLPWDMDQTFKPQARLQRPLASQPLTAQAVELPSIMWLRLEHPDNPLMMHLHHLHLLQRPAQALQTVSKQDRASYLHPLQQSCRFKFLAQVSPFLYHSD